MSSARSSSRNRLVAVAFALLGAAGCGGGGSAVDAGPADACSGSFGCGDMCNFGNSWGVGRFCTPGGGECADTPGRMAPYCTVDTDETAPAFCTRPCADETQCGENAACTGDGNTGPKGCVPIACVADEPDAGVADGGVTDAAGPDA